MSDKKIKERSYEFAIEIIKLVRLMPNDMVSIVLVRQLIRSGTSIGANVEEAQGASSKKDFANKINIAKKEAREARYWLNLIVDTGILTKNRAEKILIECNSILNILTAIVKTSTHNS